MRRASGSSTVFRGVGYSMLLAGVAVFAIRLHHAGPYAMPGGGNLRAGVLSLLLGAWLASGFFERDRVGRGLRWLALAASPVVFFFALYATLAELEEVVTLRARDSVGHTANLRLWIVDDDGTSWVRMPRSKADEHGLDDVRVQMLRQGEDRCVHVTREPDRDRKAEVNRRTYEKYRVMQLATAVGLFETGDNPNQVVLRLDPCSGVGPADD